MYGAFAHAVSGILLPRFNPKCVEDGYWALVSMSWNQVARVWRYDVRFWMRSLSKMKCSPIDKVFKVWVNWSREPLSIIEYRHRVRHHNEAGNLKTSSCDSLVHWLNIEWSWKDESGRKGWMSPPWVGVLGVIRNVGVLSSCVCERGRLCVYGSQVPSCFTCQ